MKANYSDRTIKAVLNRNFTFADLSDRFKGVDSSTGNIFCPFHENHETPAAKMYWNENQQIWVLHCFGECHRNYTAYDYVNLILCEKYQRYSSPLQYLRMNMPDGKLGLQLEVVQKEIDDFMEDVTEQKKDYINNIFSKHENITDFIEELYTS